MEIFKKTKFGNLNFESITTLSAKEQSKIIGGYGTNTGFGAAVKKCGKCGDTNITCSSSEPMPGIIMCTCPSSSNGTNPKCGDE